jgi:hypothetical protein
MRHVANIGNSLSNSPHKKSAVKVTARHMQCSRTISSKCKTSSKPTNNVTVKGNATSSKHVLLSRQIRVRPRPGLKQLGPGGKWVDKSKEFNPPRSVTAANRTKPPQSLQSTISASTTAPVLRPVAHCTTKLLYEVFGYNISSIDISSDSYIRGVMSLRRVLTMVATTPRHASSRRRQRGDGYDSFRRDAAGVACPDARDGVATAWW